MGGRLGCSLGWLWRRAGRARPYGMSVVWGAMGTGGASPPLRYGAQFWGVYGDGRGEPAPTVWGLAALRMTKRGQDDKGWGEAALTVWGSFGAGSGF